jgi:Protein of unknown function (DUF3761)
MNHAFRPGYWAAGLLLAAAAVAQTLPQAPAGAPAGSAGQCKDGSYSLAADKKGACSAHQGVRSWWGASAAATAAPEAAAKRVVPTATVAPGGGPGQVWVNGGSKAYHCPGDEWYGKTQQGQYMSEADAKAAGKRPAYGKSCF